MKWEGILRVYGQSDEMLSIHRTINQGKKGGGREGEKKNKKRKKKIRFN